MMHLDNSAVASSPNSHSNEPVMFSYQFEEMYIQSPRAERPLARMAISAFEVCTSIFVARFDVPTAAPFVRNQRPLICGFDLLHKCRVCENGLEPIVYRQRMPFEFTKDLREVVICLLGEYQI
jgi:hypothetical protein